MKPDDRAQAIPALWRIPRRHSCVFCPREAQCFPAADRMGRANREKRAGPAVFRLLLEQSIGECRRTEFSCRSDLSCLSRHRRRPNWWCQDLFRLYIDMRDPHARICCSIDFSLIEHLLLFVLCHGVDTETRRHGDTETRRHGDTGDIWRETGIRGACLQFIIHFSGYLTMFTIFPWIFSYWWSSIPA